MKAETVKSVQELLRFIKEQGKVIIVVENTEGTWYRLQKSLDAFSALNEVLWGEFYQVNLKHGEDLKKWKTPEEALYAYRDFVAEVLKSHDLDLDRGMGI
jgi:hypothetical protein